jgi:hypothetical protein
VTSQVEDESLTIIWAGVTGSNENLRSLSSCTRGDFENARTSFDDRAQGMERTAKCTGHALISAQSQQHMSSKPFASKVEKLLI